MTDQGMKLLSYRRGRKSMTDQGMKILSYTRGKKEHDRPGHELVVLQEREEKA